VLLIIGIVLFPLCHYGQVKDSIYLMNGHMVAAGVIDTTLGAVTINHPTKPGKKIHYEWDQLYMVRYSNGYKRYYYVQDSTINNWFTRQEMWMYMKGENDARKGSRAPGSFIGATLARIIGGATGTIWAPIGPFAWMMLTGIPKVRIRHSTVSNPNYIQSDAYILGYERVARQKRKISAVIGGAIGLALGFGTYIAFHDQYPETLDLGK